MLGGGGWSPASFQEPSQTLLFLLQKYIRKQVAPLFEHFRNLTLNWTEIPDGLMNQ